MKCMFLVFSCPLKKVEPITVFSTYLLAYNTWSRMLILFPCCYITCFASWVRTEVLNTLPQWSCFTGPPSAETGLKEFTALLSCYFYCLVVWLLLGDSPYPHQSKGAGFIWRRPTIQLILSPVDKEGHSKKEFQSRSLEREDLVKEW